MTQFAIDLVAACAYPVSASGGFDYKLRGPLVLRMALHATPSMTVNMESANAGQINKPLCSW
uniref:Uncharacterized protein n=1 Tax=Curvibacter symbiont subsp. Hydra magnipapillata TaxID=667019 RepID=C9Y8T1_CURXX|nr:hypothetical protein Csp_A05320 [Curvibacter putative symbiont of Hydra magnipapillata]